jgi:DNA-binding NarL/FixJ family response regulator
LPTRINNKNESVETLDPQLLDVIHGIYAAALEPAMGPVVLRKLAGIAGVEPAAFDAAAPVPRAGGTAGPAAPGPAADWGRHLEHLCALSSFATRAEVAGTRSSGPGRAAGPPPQALRALRLLMPHLQTAAALHRRIHHLHGLSHSAFAALERLQFGLVLLGPAGEWRHANSRAQEICARTQAFSCDSSGRVQALSPAFTARLHAAVHAVAGGAGAGTASGTALRLRGTSGAELHAFVLPLPHAAQPLDASAAALMFVSDPQAALPRFAHNLRRIYRLSPSEAQLAEALVNGKSLKGFAEERGTTLNTVKTQLKSVAAKVGAKRQVDVVRCILTGPAVLHL